MAISDWALAREAVEWTEQNVHEVADLDEAREVAKTGFARLSWAALGDEGERTLAEDAVSVRCLQTADGGIPADADDADLVAIVARAY